MLGSFLISSALNFRARAMCQLTRCPSSQSLMVGSRSSAHGRFPPNLSYNSRYPRSSPGTATASPPMLNWKGISNMLGIFYLMKKMSFCPKIRLKVFLFYFTNPCRKMHTYLTNSLIHANILIIKSSIVIKTNKNLIRQWDSVKNSNQWSFIINNRKQDTSILCYSLNRLVMISMWY